MVFHWQVNLFYVLSGITFLNYQPWRHVIGNSWQYSVVLFMYALRRAADWK